MILDSSFYCETSLGSVSRCGPEIEKLSYYLKTSAQYFRLLSPGGGPSMIRLTQEVTAMKELLGDVVELIKARTASFP
jgi:hypothetical protein